MAQLKDKIAIVTGANQGIGFAIAKEFVEHGATVYVFDIEESINYYQGIRFIKVDVTKEQDWKSAIQLILREYRRLDILVNNAGIIDYTPIHLIELENWYNLIAVDQTGVLLGLKHTIP